MGGRHVVHLFHGGQHLGSNPLHAADAPAMNRLEGNGRHLGGVLEAAGLPIGQLGEALVDRFGMVGHAERFLLPPAANLHHAPALGRADALDSSARKLHPGGHVVQPILETRRAEVGNEDFHGTSV